MYSLFVSGTTAGLKQALEEFSNNMSKKETELSEKTEVYNKRMESIGKIGEAQQLVRDKLIKLNLIKQVCS